MAVTGASFVSPLCPALATHPHSLPQSENSGSTHTASLISLLPLSLQAVKERGLEEALQAQRPVLITSLFSVEMKAAAGCDMGVVSWPLDVGKD